MTSKELTHFKKMVQVLKNLITIILLKMGPLIVFKKKNHITFIFIKTMSPVLLVQMAYPEAKYHKFSIKPPLPIKSPTLLLLRRSPLPL